MFSRSELMRFRNNDVITALIWESKGGENEGSG